MNKRTGPVDQTKIGSYFLLVGRLMVLFAYFCNVMVRSISLLRCKEIKSLWDKWKKQYFTQCTLHATEDRAVCNKYVKFARGIICSFCTII